MSRMLPPAWPAALLILAAGCSRGPRPARWAIPIESRTLINAYRVDGGLYRSARLKAGAAAELKALGVRTVINLRSEETDRDVLAGSGVNRLRLPCDANEITVEHLATFLRLACDPDRRPVLVHCWAGADRTGAMIAAYRVAAQGWSKEEAVREMTEGGYRFHGLVYRNLVKLITDLDVEDLRRRANIKTPTR